MNPTELPPAPFADQIREVRQQLHDARRAAIDHARVSALPSAHGAPSDMHASLLRELSDRWVPDGQEMAFAWLKAQLASIAAKAPGLEATLHQLRHEQEAELRDPRWGPTVDAINTAMRRREALAPTLRALQSRHGHLQACADAVDAAIARVDAAPDRTREPLAEATATGIRALLGHTGLDDVPGAATRGGADAIAWLRLLGPELHQEAMATAPRLRELRDEDQQLQALISYLLG